MTPLPFGMIGGGLDAFIGQIHRRAAQLDGRARLAAGALSIDPKVAKDSGAAYAIDDDRAYTSVDEMLGREAARDDKLGFITIVTPNHTHHPLAMKCLRAGFNVVLEKPMTHTSGQAQEIADLARDKGLLCCVTHNYTGYPMVRHARELVRSGAIGDVRKVFVEYHQGWLATKVEDEGVQQAVWRTDPAKAGLGGALGDIGTHAENLAEFITGLRIESLCADLTSFVHGRELDDDAAVLIRYADSMAKGVLTCSQVCVGEANGLAIRIYGTQGGITWRQEFPEQLTVSSLEGSPTTLSRGADGLSEIAKLSTRTPGGHPEGFIEAFANLYLGVIEAVEAQRTGREPGLLAKAIPTADDGVRGVQFVEACVASAREGGKWSQLPNA
ncbi:MAG: Gfo/Idh/MocA family oxidoreductase [Phycisphaerales bacterium]